MYTFFMIYANVLSKNTVLPCRVGVFTLSLWEVKQGLVVGDLAVDDLVVGEKFVELLGAVDLGLLDWFECHG